MSNLTDIMVHADEKWAIKQWLNSGHFAEELFNDINIHWLTYAPPAALNFYVFGTLYLIITIVGVVGNTLVVYLFFR